jgi:hypothetical protein
VDLPARHINTHEEMVNWAQNQHFQQPSQSLDLNSIENLWFELNRAVHKRRLNKSRIWRDSEEWSEIPPNVFSKHFSVVILPRGGCWSIENIGGNNSDLYLLRITF